MNKCITLFLCILFSPFLFGQGCPTPVDSDGAGRLLFHYGTQAAKDAAWAALPGNPNPGLTITNGVVGGITLSSPIILGKGTGLAKNNTAEYFRTSTTVGGATNANFSGTITLHYSGGDVVCNYTNGAALPVELVRFNVEKQENATLLSWATASEINNEGFEIEKSSNGIDWVVLDWVEGNGTAFEINTYNYLDRTPFVGENYYRLKQIDYDGQFDFSDIVTLRYDVKNVALEISPNPSPDGEVNLTVLNPGEEMMNIVLYNSAGSLIWESGTLSNLDIWKKEFNLTQKGLHFIRVQIGREFYMKKILTLD